MKDFHNVFAYYGSEPKKIKCQRNYTFTFHMIDDIVRVFLCQKKHQIVLETANIFLKWFVIFMKFVVFTEHWNFIWLEWVCEPCEKFDIITLQMGVF
jgi:hypothetical protein